MTEAVEVDADRAVEADEVVEATTDEEVVETVEVTSAKVAGDTAVEHTVEARAPAMELAEVIVAASKVTSGATLRAAPVVGDRLKVTAAVAVPEAALLTENARINVGSRSIRHFSQY